MWRMLERMADGEATYKEIDLLYNVTKQIEGHTICAFGEGSAWPVQGLLRHFRKEIEKRCHDEPVIKKKSNHPLSCRPASFRERQCLKLLVNNKEIDFEEGMTVLQACEVAGVRDTKILLPRKTIYSGKLQNVFS